MARIIGTASRPLRRLLPSSRYVHVYSEDLHVLILMSISNSSHVSELLRWQSQPLQQQGQLVPLELLGARLGLLGVRLGLLGARFWELRATLGRRLGPPSLDRLRRWVRLLLQEEQGYSPQGIRWWRELEVFLRPPKAWSPPMRLLWARYVCLLDLFA